VLIDRHDQLEVLDESFADCAAGKGRMVLISGSLASGKTELLQAFCERAVIQGALLLSATGMRGERTLRMGVVWQLFRSAQLPVEMLEQLERLISAEPSVVDDTDPAAGVGLETRQADALAVHGVCALLFSLAESRPVVIAVDDMQFVDDASLEVLLYLRHRMRSRRMLLALVEWERPNLPRSVLRADVVRQPNSRITLGPLSQNGVAELMTHRLSPEAAARLASGCYALGGGNPFLTHALIEDESRRAPGSDGAEMTVGTAFRDAVLDCMHRWDPEFLRVAGGMAVLGDRGSPELVGELVAVQTHSVAHVLDALAAAGLVLDGRLRGTSIAAAVHESLAPAERSRLHARGAELLYRNGADAMEVARHVTAADGVPEAWAVQLLRHAADQSLADDAGLAVRYLELALLACDDEREEMALRAALVRIAWRVNPSAAAQHLTRLQRALSAGELPWRDAVPVIRHLLWQGDLDGAAALLRAVDASVGQADNRAAVELRLAGEWIYGRLGERVSAAGGELVAETGGAALPPGPDGGAQTQPQPQRQTQPRARAGSPAAGLAGRGTVALHTLWTAGTGHDLASAAEHILQGCLGDVLPEVGAAALLALDYSDRQRRALFWTEVLSEQATRQRATTWQAVLSCVRADIALRRGDLVTTHAQASAALGMLHTQSWGVLIGFPLSLLILANTAMGEYDAAAELLDRSVPDAMLDTMFGLRYLHASGHYNLASARPLAALDNFERCGASMRRWGFDVPAMVPWRTDLAQAHLKLGMRREARELVTAQLDRPQPGVGPRVRAIALRVLAGCSQLTDRVRLLRDAVHLLERCSDRLELARALMDLSHAHRDLGDLGNARLVLRRADQVAKACRARVVPAAAPRRGPDPDPVRGGEHGCDPVAAVATSLSEAERKVAELAAHGHTNREIGRKLYITVSTVEQHLTRVYRKLSVSRRTDLPAELARYDAGARTETAGAGAGRG